MSLLPAIWAYQGLSKEQKLLLQGAALGFGIHNPIIRASAIGVARQTALAAVRIPMAAAAPFAPMVATGAMFASAAALGYTAGAVTGTLISGQLFGEQGKRDALALYTGQIGDGTPSGIWNEYWSTLRRGFLG